MRDIAENLFIEKELSAYRLDGKGGASEITLAEAEDEGDLQEPTWVHVDFSEPAGAQWLTEESQIDEVIIGAMMQDDSRPRSVRAENGALTILRGVNFNPGAEQEDMISIRIWVEAGRVVTASRRNFKSLGDILNALSENHGPNSSSGLLIDIIDRIGNYIGEFVETIEDRIESVEAEVGDPKTVIQNSPYSVLRRQTARIRRYLAPQRDALEHISRMADSVFDQSQLFEIREQVNRFTLILEDLDLARERAMVAQEEYLGILAHEQNNRMLVLSIVAAIFLPLSFLTGLMGMNVAGLPGTENAWAFAILVVIMLILTMVILLLFRLKKWV